MSVVAHHILLGGAALALGDASLRAASAAAPRGLARLVAAAPVAGSAVVILALLLGAVGLGGSSVAIAIAVGLVWLAAAAGFPPAHVSLIDDAATWWRGTQPGWRTAALAAGGAGLAFVAWAAHNPVIGVDGVTYHLSEAAAWVHSGHTGAVVDSFYDVPAGNYPLAGEVQVSLAMALSRSFVPGLLFTPALVALAAAAGWLGLRTVRVPRLPAALALLALVTVPLVFQALDEPGTDIAATAWLICAWALVMSARRSPLLLAPALLAAGLAVGTKTTALPLAAVVVAIGAAAHRPALRRLRAPLGLAAACALVVGGFWYLRNLVTHGSPLWPFNTAPWGTGKPALIDAIDFRLLDRPRATLEHHWGDYVGELGGAIALLAAAVAAPLLVRRREVVWAAAVTAIGLLLWTVAPVTGVGDVPALAGLPLTATRYMLPTIAAAALAVALAAREPGWRGAAATAALAGVVVWSVLAKSPLAFPRGPSGWTLLAGAAGGVVAGSALAWTGSRARSFGRRPAAPSADADATRGGAGSAPGAPRRPAAALAWSLRAAAVAILAGLAMTAAANGYVERYARLRGTAFSDLSGWFAAQPGWKDSTTPVQMASARPAPLAGDRLSHPVELIRANASCAQVAGLRARGWVILADFPSQPVFGHPGHVFPDPGPAGCLRRLPPAAKIGPWRVYRPLP